MRGERASDLRDAAMSTALVFGLLHASVFVFELLAGDPAWRHALRHAPLLLAEIGMSLLLYPLIRWCEDRPLPQRIACYAAGVCATALALSGIMLLLAVAQGEAPAAMLTDPAQIRYWLAVSLIVPIYIHFVGFNTAIIVLNRSRNRTARDRERLFAMEAAAVRAQLLALRLQVNPHFLFNALNAISSFIVTRRRDEAEEAISLLSDFLRASLGQDAMAMVPLEDEIAAAEAYLAIEAVRFQERMIVQVDYPPACAGVPVPNLLLQPLVENAVKYGVNPSLRPVVIAIHARLEGERLVIVVSDDAAPPHVAPPPGTGIGMRNVRDRLAFIYGDAATMTTQHGAAGFAVALTLPVQPPAGPGA